MCYSSVWNNRTFICFPCAYNVVLLFFIEDNTGIKRASFILFIILFMFMSLVKKEPTNFSASKCSLEKFKNARWWMFFRGSQICKKRLRIFAARKSFIIFCAEIVVRGNAVQICSDFPAKRLSIFLKIFSWHLSSESKRQLK